MAGCSVIAIVSMLAFSQQAAADDAPSSQESEVEQVVVTAQATAVDSVSTVRGALVETEPESIITRKFIEETAPRVGDFTTIADFAPSMVAKPNPNGPGNSDGGKLTMRGFSDGQYNVTYDGIAWGDTNGPSHHGTAFFPASTIGGIIVDRGPGGATDLGQANFGGQVNLFSLALDDQSSVDLIGTVGAWGTWQTVGTYQTGSLDEFHGAKLLINVQANDSSGYLTNNFTHAQTQMVKGSIPLSNNIMLTALYTHSSGFYNKSDIGDASVAQTTLYGRNFSLGSDPTLQDYYGYNWVKKNTDFEYVRAEGDLGGGFGFNNTIYGYDYTNHTESSQNNLAAASANLVTSTPGAAYPAPGKTYSASLQSYGIPGYLKLNEYYTYGDIAKFTKQFDFGELTVGTLYEVSHSHRYIFDINLLTGNPDYREKAATAFGPTGVYTDTPLNIQYNEFSGWHQYQPFAQFVWKPTDELTVTPGIKYVNFDLHMNAPEESLSVGNQPLFTDKDFTKTLPFLTANYRIDSGWAVYAQYAQGFLVPNIGSLYVANVSTKVVPQQSTNYQVGTVYSAGQFSADGDFYYIDFKNKIQSFVDATTGQSYETNSGGAIYRGLEGEGTYALPYGIAAFANGSLNQAIGTNDRSNPLYNGHQLTGAAPWTAGLGLRVQQDNVIASDDDFIVSFIDKWDGPQYINNAKCSSAPNGICAPNATLTPVAGLIGATQEADLSATYRVGSYSIEGQILNLFNGDGITSAKGSAYIAGTTRFAQTVAQGGGNNALEYQVPRTFEITLKARL